MFPFKYDRYSAKPIKNDPPIVDIKYLESKNNIKIFNIEDEFNNYISILEKQRGFKYSRKDKRDLYRKFLKTHKK